MSLYSMIAPKGANGFGYGSTAEQVTEGVSLAGKTMVVTGCNSGLGLETMRVLAMRGAHVIGTARTETKASEAGRSVSGKTTSAPRDSTNSIAPGRCTSAMTRAPNAFAIWMAAVPTPPAEPSTSTVSPARNAARRTNPKYIV